MVGSDEAKEVIGSLQETISPKIKKDTWYKIYSFIGVGTIIIFTLIWSTVRITISLTNFQSEMKKWDAIPEMVEKHESKDSIEHMAMWSQINENKNLLIRYVGNYKTQADLNFARAKYNDTVTVR